MNNKQRIISPGTIVQHFKGDMYQVICISNHSETKEKMVTYTPYNDNVVALNHEKIYTRPYDMFMSEVDTIKYPNAKQKYRFEIIKQGDTAISRDEMYNGLSLGLKNQLMILIEEMSELTQAICKYKRKTENGTITPLSFEEIINNLIEELADVELVLNQVKLLLNYNTADIDIYDEIQHVKSQKTQRHMDRVRNQKE